MSRFEPTGQEFSHGPDCDLCGGSRSPRPGLICVGEHRPPEAHAELALCLCRDGLLYRANIPRGVKALLAHRFQIPIANVVLVEDVVDEADIPVALRPKGPGGIDIGAAGMRTGRAKL
jgi:hypothetical protein